MTPAPHCAFLDGVFCRGDEHCQYKLTTACYPLGEKFCGKDLILGSPTSAEQVLEQIEKIISDRIWELKYPKSYNCVRAALLGENQALWAQIAEFRAQRGRDP